MPNPDGTRIVIPILSGTSALRKGPEGLDLAADSAGSYELKYNKNGTIDSLVSAAGTQTLTNKTITTPTFTRTVTAYTTTPQTPSAALCSGGIFTMAKADGIAITLPTIASGLWCRFVCALVPTSVGYVITSAAANQFVGSVLTADVNSATDPDFEAAGANTITFVANKAAIGDFVDMVSDGTNWFVFVSCSLFDAVTLTDV